MANYELECRVRSKSMEAFRKKQVCEKVEDPYFGHRKTPENLKRIQRKLALRNNNTGDGKSGEKLTNVQSTFRDENLKNLTTTDHSYFRSKTTMENENRAARKSDLPRPWTTPTESEMRNATEKTEWMTKEEFVNKLFKSF